MSPAAETSRVSAALQSPRVWVPATLVIIFAVAAIYAAKLFAECDDTYIYLVYVRSFFDGEGLTYNGMKVQGFTSVLWVAILVVAAWLPGELPDNANHLSMLSGLFVLVATYFLARAADIRRLVAFGICAVVALGGDFAFYMSNGMETVFFTGMVVLCARFLFSKDPSGTLRSPYLPFVGALTILARPEGAIAVAVVVIYLSWKSRSWWGPLIPTLGISAVLGPVLIGLHAYYGDWLPNTYYAKAGGTGLTNIGQGLRYLSNFFDEYSLAIVLLLFVVVLRRKVIGSVAVPFLLIILLWVVNTTLQGGDNLVGLRAYLPVVPLIPVVVVLGMRGASTRLVLGSLAVIAATQYVKYNHGHLYGSSWNKPVAKHALGWREAYNPRRTIGVHLDGELKPGSIIALNAAGIIPYYSKLPTIDMLGLNNRHIARNGNRDRSLPYGHQAGDGKYVLEQKPAVIIFSGAGADHGGFYVSDREIQADPSFQQNYQPKKLPNGRNAYFRILRREDMTPVGKPRKVPRKK